MLLQAKLPIKLFILCLHSNYMTKTVSTTTVFTMVKLQFDTQSWKSTGWQKNLQCYYGDLHLYS